MNKKEYYEQPKFWSFDFEKDSHEALRIQDTVEEIPCDIATILDVGCGNGAILNRLSKYDKNKYKLLMGIDISKEALQYVKTQKVRGDISKLPFKNSSFDLIICTEVIEHSEFWRYPLVLRELERVTQRYVLITVPNDENLEANLVCCPNCGCWYNQEYHMNSFNYYKMLKLFENLNPVTVKEIGPSIKVNKYRKHGLLYYVYYLKPKPAFYGICPQCEYRVPKAKHKDNTRLNKRKISFKRILGSFKLFLYKRVQTKKFLMGIYKKTIE